MGPTAREANLLRIQNSCIANGSEFIYIEVGEADEKERIQK
jgi:hypothetical protein